jgi:hypothetical protein
MAIRVFMVGEYRGLSTVPCVSRGSGRDDTLVGRVSNGASGERKKAQENGAPEGAPFFLRVKLKFRLRLRSLR